VVWPQCKLRWAEDRVWLEEFSQLFCYMRGMIVFLHHVVGDGLDSAVETELARAIDDCRLWLIDMEIELLKEIPQPKLGGHGDLGQK
jgi:hypothetical protein